MRERPNKLGRQTRAMGCCVLCMLAACMPDVPSEARPSFLEFEFDPATSKIFEPTSLVMSEQTGRIDLSAADIEVPTADDPGACAEQAEMSVAQCEFYQYLEQLDGFPTVAGGKTPTSAELDMTTATVPENLFVYDISEARALEDLEVGFDENANLLTFEPRSGWNPGASYLVGVRGYDQGIRGRDGVQSVSSVIYALLKSLDSLTCGATSVGKLDVTCESYALLAGDARFASLSPKARHDAVARDLLDLEKLRRHYAGDNESGTNLWTTLERTADMPREEVAIGWFFRTHSGSVLELDPRRGMTPVVASPSELRLALKGTLDPGTMRPFSLADPGGTVFLLNADKLADNPFDPRSLPPFEPSYSQGDVVLRTTDPDNSFIEGDTYALVFTDEVTDAGGAPLVASPVTVLLRIRGVLVDEHGASEVDGFSDEDAQELEAGRLQFEALLDDPLIQAATQSPARPEGLVRERITYLFALPFVTP